MSMRSWRAGISNAGAPSWRRGRVDRRAPLVEDAAQLAAVGELDAQQRVAAALGEPRERDARADEPAGTAVERPAHDHAGVLLDADRLARLGALRRQLRPQVG